MFISRGLYERAPYYWVILGVLLIVMGTYLGASADAKYYVGGTGGGILACIWGLLIFRKRLSREARRPCSTYDEYLEQTCELSFRPDPPRDQLPGQPYRQI
jgi:hypothetical protein